MFSNVFSSPLVLQIGEESLQFKSTRELEFVLGTRTTLSARRTASLIGLSEPELEREAEAFKRMAVLVAEALDQAEDDLQSLDEFLRELDHSQVEEDNDWRPLLLALSQADDRYGAFKLAAVSKYRTYLMAGQELIEAVVTERRQNRAPLLGVETLFGEPKPRQRMVFSVRELLGHEPDALEFVRLPKGEPVVVRFAVHQSLTLLLARHRYVLVSGEPWLLVDPTGNETRLQSGASVVGRHPDADIIVFPGYRSVSRKHLVIETDGFEKVAITDTSSMGTFAALREADGVVH